MAVEHVNTRISPLGFIEHTHYDETAGKLYTTIKQDLTKLLESNKRLRAEESYFARPKSEKLVGRIPICVIHDMEANYGIDIYSPEATVYFEKWLNENPMFKTTNKRV